jgi:hypothetical protein
MKQKPDLDKIQSKMYESHFSSFGFMGDDTRKLTDIIRQDSETLIKLKITKEQLSKRMQHITEKAAAGLGTPVIIDSYLECYTDDSRGRIPCPFSQGCFAEKRVTYVKNLKTNEEIKWSDLNIHMIKEHGFFEGNGAEFRLNPVRLYKTIFI